MDHQLIEVILGVLILSVALNLLLTFRIFSVLKEIPMPDTSQVFLEAGDLLPDFRGQTLIEKNEVLSNHLDKQPMVMVFVAPGCPKCKSKLPEIKQMLPSMQQVGVQFWLVGMGGRWTVKRFLKGSGLTDKALLIDAEHRKKLNPNRSSPFYMFVDENSVLQASGLLGDENWLNFVEQMREVAA